MKILLRRSQTMQKKFIIIKYAQSGNVQIYVISIKPKWWRIKSSNINGFLTPQWLSVVTLVFGVWLTLMVLGCFSVPFVSQPKNDSKVWNSGRNIRYQTETMRGHLICTSEKRKRKSYFVEKERDEASQVNKIYEKIFHAVYWLAKEEIVVVKFKLILTLLESVGVEYIELFDTRSSHIGRKMVIMLSDLLKEKLMSNIKRPECTLYLPTKTQISPTCSSYSRLWSTITMTLESLKQNFYTLLTYFQNQRKQTPMQNRYLKAWKNPIQNQLQLDLADLKAFVSDGASVTTVWEKGVAARFRKVEESSTTLNVHCVCHRLALACSDTGDKLKFIEDFELTMIHLWKFFKSPKRLKI